MNNKPLLYTPVLYSKRGEYNALFELSSNIKKYIKPLLILTREKTNSRGEKFAKTIKDKWDDNPVYVDLDQADSVIIQGLNYVDFILNDLDVNNVDYTPLISLRYPNQRIINHIIQNGLKSCIRVDIETFDHNTVTDFQRLLDVLLESRSSVDVLLDFKSDIISDASLHAHYISNYYGIIYNNFGNWLDKFIVTGSVIPKELDTDRYSPYGLEKRRHWLGFYEFIKSLNQEAGSIIYSDYSISYFEEEEFDTLTNPNAKIKYTISDSFAFFVGNQVFKRNNNISDGFEQFQTLSRTIVNSKYYLGSAYSWGDKQIQGCANGTESNGNLETWVKVGHNHHITLTTKQNASHYGISI